jgi:hypothetical protein
MIWPFGLFWPFLNVKENCIFYGLFWQNLNPKKDNSKICTSYFGKLSLKIWPLFDLFLLLANLAFL